MRKQLCACGCGDRVTLKVERKHLNVLAPALLASQVLESNQASIHRKKRSRAYGFPAPLHHPLTMQKISEIDDNFHMDHAGPSGLITDDDSVSHHSPMIIEQHPDIEQSKYHKYLLMNISLYIYESSSWTIWPY